MIGGFDFPLIVWALLGLSALLVGLSKTAIPGINTISIAVFAAVLPTRSSTAALLLLLIFGDVFALLMYRKYADWQALIKLVPPVVVGLALGALFLAFSHDSWVRKVIGVVLVLVVALTVWRRHASQKDVPGASGGLVARLGYGSLGGFTTMVANAGGPVMSMYFLATRLPVHTFLGTAAWFFASINIVKVPISIGLGLFTWETTLLSVMLAPGVVIGAFVGRWITKRINQQLFEWTIVAFTLLGAVYLIAS